MMRYFSLLAVLSLVAVMLAGSMVNGAAPPPDPVVVTNTEPAPTPEPTPIYGPADIKAELGQLTSSVGVGISSATLASGAQGGETGELTLDLGSIGDVNLPIGARLVFVPSNDQAQPVGELTTTKGADGTTITLPFTIPKEPGTYVYMFNPKLVTTDPGTGTDVRMPAGNTITFTVVVGQDGSASVRTE